MITSNNGRRLIQQHEGLELTAYPDPATGAAPWTIGYGHTKGVTPGQQITREQAEQFLIEDLAIVANTITANVKVALNQNQFDALSSFIFNVGSGNFTDSTLLKKLNIGDYDGAADEFLRWDKAAGKVMPGLTKRRTAERQLFLEPCPS
ncbi:lysozyme [Intestinirhabdus alba]|jgi:lysozyme|uniref:Lysozyme n=1 Tax=Intestinirhabdus alba TaxID=2899544 RepID=A0A6L6IR49_9ENTR|nr:lysozyme [Intestinirhabdus alba]MTH47490.1 glycoside hydrolase family protein [Intestinirhabdus alba]